MSYLSDQEQKQMLKKFWKEYGAYILIFILAFLVGNFFWRYFRHYKMQRSEYASVVYMQMLNAREAKQPEQAKLFTKKLTTDYKHSPYASLAAMFVARDQVQKGKLDIAAHKLNWVIENSSQDAFQQIARIRLARVLLAQKKDKDALSMLKKINASELLPLVNEVRGDVLLAMGNKKESQAAYQVALKGIKAEGLESPLLEMKLRQFPE